MLDEDTEYVEKVLCELNDVLMNVAGFTSAIMEIKEQEEKEDKSDYTLMYFEKMHKYYEETSKALKDAYDEAQEITEKGIRRHLDEVTDQEGGEKDCNQEGIEQ